MDRQFFLLFRASLQNKHPTCSRCLNRYYTRSAVQRAATKAIQDKSQKAEPPAPTPSTSKNKVEEYNPYKSRFERPEHWDRSWVPPPLGRPIGYPNPPQPGENTGIDSRTFAERRRDYWDQEKQTKKQHELLYKMWGESYFKDISGVNYSRGKIFTANPSIFKSEVALYFPNLYGTPLDSTESFDTTPLLKGKVSLVNVYSSMWGENQIENWMQSNGVDEALEKHKDILQRVDFTLEDNFWKRLLVNIFKKNIRKKTPKERHSKYYFIRNGVMTDEMRELIGLKNSRIGNVYIVDQDCKIRWAGSADPTDEERRAFIKGLNKVVEQARTAKMPKIKSRQR
jgi:mitochondrial ATPase complex subunit ATP10